MALTEQAAAAALVDAAAGAGGPEAILRRQSLRESAARTYARSLPIVPVRARGLTIEGADGRRYLDCLSGAGTLALGHNHPVVLEAIRKVLDSGAPLHVLDLATPVKDAFTTELFANLPGPLAAHGRVQFCGPAGTDAVEAALKLVRTATGRSGLLAFTGAYHGMTAGALDASGGAQDVRVTRLPYPQDYRCPFGTGGRPGAELAARWTESLLDDPKGGVAAPAGMILEPVQGEGGVLPAPDDWLRRMRTLTRERGIPLIADEVQTGVGRTGAFWGVDHAGVVPDVMVLSKAIGGSLPLAVVVYHEDLDVWQPGAHAGTFRGNQLAMAAGTATLAYVRENRLAQRAAALGDRMLTALRGLAAGHPCIGDVRGRGLMIGVEIVDPEAPRHPGLPAGEHPPPPVGAGPSAPGGAHTAAPGGPAGHRTPAQRRGSATPGPGDSPQHPGSTGHLDAPHGTDATHRPGAGGGQGTGGGWGTSDRQGAGGGQGAGAGPGPGGVGPGGPGPGGTGYEGPAYGGLGHGVGPDHGRRPAPADPALAAAVRQECLRRGLIVELGGRHSSVVRLLPPLTITDEQAAAVLDRLADAIDAAERARRHTRSAAHRTGHLSKESP